MITGNYFLMHGRKNLLEQFSFVNTPLVSTSIGYAPHCFLIGISMMNTQANKKN